MTSLADELYRYADSLGENIESFIYRATEDSAIVGASGEYGMLKKHLNVEFPKGEYVGYEGALFAWTKNFVFFIHVYDGAPDLRCVPRNPGQKHLYQVCEQ